MESRRTASPLSLRPDPRVPPEYGVMTPEERELREQFAGRTWPHVTVRDGVIDLPVPPAREGPQEPITQEFLDFQRMTSLAEMREHPDRFCQVHHVRLGGGHFALSRTRIEIYGRHSSKAYVLVDGICGHCERDRIAAEQPELLQQAKQKRAPTTGKRAGQKELLVTYGDL